MAWFELIDNSQPEQHRQGAEEHVVADDDICRKIPQGFDVALR
jgi:hypothetical protein